MSKNQSKRGKKKGGRTPGKNKGQSKIVHQFSANEFSHNKLTCKCR